MGLLISSNQHAGYGVARGWPRRPRALRRSWGRHTSSRCAPDMDVFDPTRLIRRYGTHSATQSAAREMTLPVHRLESAAKRVDLETERQP